MYRTLTIAACLAVLPGIAFAQTAAQQPPVDLLPPTLQTPSKPIPVQPTPAPVAVPVPAPVVIPTWPISDAQALLAAIKSVGAEGLKPADYLPTELETAIANGPSEALNAAATKSFTWLIEDLRDGRTPMTARLQWFVVDPDTTTNPTEKLLAKALETRDVTGVLKSLAPRHPDYAILKAALAKTTAADKARAQLIEANMDRWRWLQQDLGVRYMMTNVPEYQLRLVVKDKIVGTYRTIVGKPGKTATPQLAEIMEGVIFNPTWTVPQSIVKGEGLGAKLVARPQADYKVTKNGDGSLTVVQQPGPRNSLGLIKIDMPNPHAIFLHDTPARGLFNVANRALSHGCIRTDRASELGMTLALLLGDVPTDQSVNVLLSNKYTRVAFKRQMPVFITYFTMANSIDGKLATFRDIYGRDAAIFDAMKKPRELRSGAMKQTQKVIAITDPGA
jgi:L,D-transpeptidase YcbB